LVADPYPRYAKLRRRGRIHYDEHAGLWLVPRYADVVAVLRDRRFTRSYLHAATHAEMGRPSPPAWQAPFWNLIENGMLDMGPPDHARLRSLVSQAFTPTAVASLRGRIQQVMDQLVDDVSGVGEGDLLATVAEPLSVTVIAELLGVPPADRYLLRPWSAAICAMFELHPSDETARAAVRASVEFSSYMRLLARHRRVRPAGDLLSTLAQVADDGDRLTEDELVGTCVLLLNAGHEASVNVLGNGMLALLHNREQLGLLHDNPALAPAVVEEVLRYDTPLQMFKRWVLQDTEICGQTIPKGAALALLFGSANRDPAVFDHPDVLDVTRRTNPHLAFGAGTHYCLGALLARLELAVAFGTLARRLPQMELAARPCWRLAYVIRGLETLQVIC
jgi:cytochrome P450